MDYQGRLGASGGCPLGAVNAVCCSRKALGPARITEAGGATQVWCAIIPPLRIALFVEKRDVLSVYSEELTFTYTAPIPLTPKPRVTLPLAIRAYRRRTAGSESEEEMGEGTDEAGPLSQVGLLSALRRRTLTCASLDCRTSCRAPRRAQARHARRLGAHQTQGVRHISPYITGSQVQHYDYPHTSTRGTIRLTGT